MHLCIQICNKCCLLIYNFCINNRSARLGVRLMRYHVAVRMDLYPLKRQLMRAFQVQTPVWSQLQPYFELEGSIYPTW